MKQLFNSRMVYVTNWLPCFFRGAIRELFMNPPSVGMLLVGGHKGGRYMLFYSSNGHVHKPTPYDHWCVYVRHETAIPIAFLNY